MLNYNIFEFNGFPSNIIKKSPVNTKCVTNKINNYFDLWK